MTNADTVAELRFEPPAPGSWERDAVHFPRPVTRYWPEMHPAAFARGTGDFARFYGMLIGCAGIGVRQRLRLPADACRRRGGDPRALPARAEEVCEGKLWREQLREWDETRQARRRSQAHRELQAVDPDALSDEELVDVPRRAAATTTQR